MIHLPTRILCLLIHSSSPLPAPCVYPLASLHRLLSATAPSISPNPCFAIEDYLVATCGLTRPEALKASMKLSHLKSPSKPDAVIAFLRDLGFSSTDVAALVAKDPQFLCADVKRTLAPKVVDLTALGISRPEIARLVPLILSQFRRRSISSKLQYHVQLFGSFHNLLRALKRNNSLLSSNLERVVKPNVALLQECLLDARDIAKTCLSAPRLLNANPKRVQAMVAYAEGIGLRRGSGMFRSALLAVAFLSKEKIAAKMDYLNKTFGWSDVEGGIAVSRAPMVLRKSKDNLQRVSEFLISEAGLDPVYIAHRPVMINYSLEGRLRPRHYVLKFLRKNGLPNHDYYNAVTVTENVFMEKFVCPHKEAAPLLAEDYAAACKGEVPTRFRYA